MLNVEKDIHLFCQWTGLCFKDAKIINFKSNELTKLSLLKNIQQANTDELEEKLFHIYVKNLSEIKHKCVYTGIHLHLCQQWQIVWRTSTSVGSADPETQQIQSTDSTQA